MSYIPRLPGEMSTEEYIAWREKEELKKAVKAVVEAGVLLDKEVVRQTSRDPSYPSLDGLFCWLRSEMGVEQEVVDEVTSELEK